LLYALKEISKPVLIAASITLGIFLLIEFLPIKSRLNTREIRFVIFEGQTVKEINKSLKEYNVLKEGDSFLNVDQNLEGYLFPDTYYFYKNSSSAVILEKIFKNFYKKADPILSQDGENYDRNLIIASLIEKEVPSSDERRIVAGIILKRLEVGMPLQVDATLCYIKSYAYSLGQKADSGVDSEIESCYPITKKDKEVDSLYNTYLYKGIPPKPISNPGEDAIRAVFEAKSSPYWYYLSDPVTKKTIFSKTLEEHNINRRRYLSN